MTSARMLILAVTAIIASVCALFFYKAVAAAQEDVQSANYLIDACRVVASGATPKGDEMFQAGLCIGKVEALSWVATGLTDDRLRSCRPSAVTPKQIAKVVVTYLDRNPARLHEPFVGLALEALANAWPCARQDASPDTLGDILRRQGIEPTK